MKEKSLKAISWQVPEETYREDPSLSYSTLATFERSGFNGLSTLFDRKETASLTFGSAVDAIITGGQQEFDAKFMIADFPPLSEKAVKITKDLFRDHGIAYTDFDSIPDEVVLSKIEEYEYWNNCKAETKLKKLKDENAASYYELLQLASDKTPINSETYANVLATVAALKESPATAEYFAADNPFDDSIEHLYQLKFKATLDGIDYRCMSDLLIVDYANKKIIPVDLKTSSHTEWDFAKSFVQWNYQIQARLYWRIIRDNLDRDSYFKDFTLDDYRFIVANKETLTPLVWKFTETTTVGDIVIPTIQGDRIILRDPQFIGEELSKYLKDTPKVPNGIVVEGDNDIIEWIRKS